MKSWKIAFAAAIVGFASVGVAQAADRYAAVTVANPLNTSITFEWKAANGNWNKFTIAPKSYHTFRHRYAFVNEHKSPSFYVTFDGDMGPGTFYSKGKLQRYGVPDEASRGKIYEFRFDGPTGRYIHLFAVN